MQVAVVIKVSEDFEYNLQHNQVFKVFADPVKAQEFVDEQNAKVKNFFDPRFEVEVMEVE
jgi:hypothetical protein